MLLGCANKPVSTKVCLLIYSHIRQHIGVVDPLCLGSDIFVNTDPRRRVSRRNGGDGVTKPTVAPNGGPLTLTQYLRLLKIVHNGEILPIVPWAFFEKYKWFDHVFQRAEDVFQTIPLFLLSAPKLNNVHTIWGHHQGSKGIIPKYNNRQLLWGCETNQGWKGWGRELHHLLFLVAVLFFPRKT